MAQISSTSSHNPVAVFEAAVAALNAVAEYHVAQWSQQSDSQSRIEREFPGMTSIEEIAALAPDAVFARWLQGKSMRRQFEHLVAAGRIAADVAAHRASLPFDPYDYVSLGSLADGEAIAHVLYRPRTAPPDEWTGATAEWFRGRPVDEQEYTREVSGRARPYVATCRRQADRSWRLLADYEFLHVSSIHLTRVGMTKRDGDGAAD